LNLTRLLYCVQKWRPIFLIFSSAVSAKLVLYWLGVGVFEV
jgi:hypothetical protein